MVDIFIGGYSLNTIRLDSASLAKVEDDGGYQIDLLGLYREEPARLQLVNQLTLVAYECYGAFSGQGYSPSPKSPTLISLATPPLPVGTYAFKITQSTYSFTSTGADVPFTLAVVRRQWKAQTFTLRRVFPPWYKLGPRNLDNVGLLT